MRREKSQDESSVVPQSLFGLIQTLKISGFTIIFFGSFGFMQILGWPLLERWQIKGHKNFVDLSSVLGSADCYRSIGFKIYDYPIGHECAYNYGSWLMRTISLIGLKASHTENIGWIFIFSVSLLLAFIISRSQISLINVIFSLLIFVSPPIMLLLERGNIDILIVLMIVFSGQLMSSGRINLSLIIIISSFLYKFYTAGLAFIAVFFSRTLFVFFLWVGILGLGLLQVVNDFRSGPGFINTEWTSFGAPVIGIYFKYLGVEIPFVLCHILGLVLLVIAIWLFSNGPDLLKSIFDELKRANLEEMNSYYIFIFLVTVHTSCYVLGMNFDYRLIMIAIANFILVTQSKISLTLRKAIAIVTVLIMWTSYNLQIAQPFGDFLIGVVTAHYVFVIWWFLQRSDRLTAILQIVLRLHHRLGR